jgi:hypothetical protein
MSPGWTWECWRRGWESNPSGVLITRKLLTNIEAKNVKIAKSAGVGDVWVTWEFSTFWPSATPLKHEKRPSRLGPVQILMRAAPWPNVSLHKNQCKARGVCGPFMEATITAL